MRGFRIFGDYALEFLVVTVLLAVSALLVLPFFPMLTGVTGYFDRDIDTRRFRDIFTGIGANWKVLIFYTLFQLIIIIFPVLNIYFFTTHPENMNYFVLAVSYIALVVGLMYVITSPTVIANMKVKFRQLLYNGIMMLFGGLWRTLIAMCLIAGIVALVLFYPYVLVLTLYAFPLINSKLMKENFLHLKAKALKVSVFELKRQDKADDYIDEYGEIKRDEEEEDEKK